MASAKQDKVAIKVHDTFLLPDEVEEEAKISSIEYYKQTTPRLVLFGFLILASGGLLLLLCKWYETLHVKIRAVRSNASEATHCLVFGEDGTVTSITMIKKDLCLTGQIVNYKCFIYRLYTYYFDVSDKKYKPVQFIIANKTYEAVINEFGAGITSSKIYNERSITYGKNSTDIERKSNLEILIDEISSPFYIFQAFAIIFWAEWNDYFLYAMIILGISVLNLTIAFVKTKLSLNKLYERAHYEIPMVVMRADGAEGSKLVPKVVSSSTLVPGDLVEIPCNKKMPCDVILLSGTCVMNESMLTGEAIPIIKQQISKSDKVFDVKTADQYLLYSGTECLETRKSNKSTPVYGFVVRTGFDTMKGKLVRSFLYSKPENFKFYRDSVKYIGAMACVAIICFLVGIKSYKEQEAEAGEYIIHLLEIITCAVPPALPTCLAVGSAMAALRLEKNKIFTKTELKINVAGRVKIMCFDKTGTLTKDSLDLFGVRAASKKESNVTSFDKLATENIHTTFNVTNENSTSQKMLELMATCHALTYVKGVVAGDPLDLKMFNATNWNLKENDGSAGPGVNLCSVNPPQDTAANGYYKSNTIVEVVKRFEFLAKLQRMSVIVKNPQENTQRVYVKGSPEVITTLCKPETLPQDLAEALMIYTQSGLRVIACATRIIQENVTVESQLERDGFENNLEFLGLLVFENKLKEATTSVIKKLKNAEISTMMLTGDNPMTAIFVARECGIVESHHSVILGTMVASESDPQAKRIQWKYIQQSSVSHTAGNTTLQPLKNQIANQGQPLLSEVAEKDTKTGEISNSQLHQILQKDSDIAIALTGEATNYITETTDINDSLRKNIFKRSKVFARMKPDDKAYIVSSLQDQGEIVGMCGDGANDCPALKVANVGIALSEAEASLAAPFMSRIIDISAVDIVLREGRCALVTSFQCFKFMSIYALIQTFNIAILNTRVSGMTNGTFLYEDLYVVLPLCLTMGITGPTKKLSKKRPNENLLSLTVLIGMFGQCLIQISGQVIGAAILARQEWYLTPTELFDAEFPDGGDEESSVVDWDLSVVFLIAAFQFFATVMTFSIAKPFRKPFYTNWLFTLCLIYSTATTLVLILIPIQELYDLLEIKDFSVQESFRWIILAVVLVNGVITYSYEKFAVPFIVKNIEKFTKRANNAERVKN